MVLFVISMVPAVVYVVCMVAAWFAASRRVRLYSVAVIAALAVVVIDLFRREWVGAVVWVGIVGMALFTLRLALRTRRDEAVTAELHKFLFKPPEH